MPSLTIDDRAFIKTVLALLDIEETSMTDEPLGVGFVGAELGTWLTVRRSPGGPSAFSVECRLARDVTESPSSLSYLDRMNQYADVGRMIFDQETSVVAVTADVPYDLASAEACAFIVASVVATAEAASYRARPRTELKGAKAVTVLDGDRRRTSAHQIVNFVSRSIIPRGDDPAPAMTALAQLQDVMLYSLPDWYIEHEHDHSIAERRPGESFLVRAARHPAPGCGLMITFADRSERWQESAALPQLAELNRQLQIEGGLGTWTLFEDHFERRVFLPNMLLALLAPELPVPRLLVATITSVAMAADAHPNDPLHPVLQRPAWPHDDLGAVLARTEPTNEGPETSTAFVWTDRLGRPAYTARSGFDHWRSGLVAADLADPDVSGFISWWRRQAGESST